MEGKEVYLVIGEEGESSDYARWMLAAWSTEAAAERHVELAEEMRKRLAAGAPLTAEDKAIDPETFWSKNVGEIIHWRYLRSAYSVDTIRLDPDLPATGLPEAPR